MYNCVAMQLVTGRHWLNIKPLAVLLGIGKGAIPIGQGLANWSQDFARFFLRYAVFSLQSAHVMLHQEPVS